MGYTGKIESKLLAQQMRRQGFSYKEILTKIKVSKDTISRWCKDIELSEKQKSRLLHSKELGQRKGSLIAAENKRNLRKERTKVIFKLSKKAVGKLTERDRFIMGIALYAAEGTKTDRQGAFTNSDPRQILFMVNWFREFCKVPQERLHGALWLHEGLSEETAQQYWSRVTGIPIKNFYKTYRSKDKKDSHKIRKNVHQYGVFAIRFTHAEIHRHIIGWISALFDGKISTIPL